MSNVVSLNEYREKKLKENKVEIVYLNPYEDAALVHLIEYFNKFPDEYDGWIQSILEDDDY